jgi:hypothetical protein
MLICPIMSRPNSDLDSARFIECKEEDCALFILDKEYDKNKDKYRGICCLKDGRM